MAWFWCYGYRINRWVSEWDLTLITDRKWHNGHSLTLWLSVIRDVSTSKSLVSILDPQIESSYLTISKNPVTHYDQLMRTRDWFHLNIYWHWQCILRFDNPWVTLFPTVSKKNFCIKWEMNQLEEKGKFYSNKHRQNFEKCILTLNRSPSLWEDNFKKYWQ